MVDLNKNVSVARKQQTNKVNLVKDRRVDIVTSKISQKLLDLVGNVYCWDSLKDELKSIAGGNFRAGLLKAARAVLFCVNDNRWLLDVNLIDQGIEITAVYVDNQ